MTSNSEGEVSPVVGVQAKAMVSANTAAMQVLLDVIGAQTEQMEIANTHVYSLEHQAAKLEDQLERTQEMLEQEINAKANISEQLGNSETAYLQQQKELKNLREVVDRERDYDWMKKKHKKEKKRVIYAAEAYILLLLKISGIVDGCKRRTSKKGRRRKAIKNIEKVVKGHEERMDRISTLLKDRQAKV